MAIKNTDQQYGIIAIFFHWLMAILIIGLIALGLYMVDLPISLQKLKLYGWHKEFGILILMLACLRILWRLINRLPTLPSYIPRWQQLAARIVHYVFYFFMFALPLTGWIISSAAGLSVSFFGLFLLPNLVSPNQATMSLFSDIHDYLAYSLIAIIGLHIAAVIEHYLVHKENILRKIWP
jgi:cytochrome b561